MPPLPSISRIWVMDDTMLHPVRLTFTWKGLVEERKASPSVFGKETATVASLSVVTFLAGLDNVVSGYSDDELEKGQQEEMRGIEIEQSLCVDCCTQPNSYALK